MRKVKTLFLICPFLFFSFNSLAQATKADSLIKDSVLSKVLRVFIDMGTCSYCDYSYIRKEINYVNYVRDPKESQVQVIILENTTGSGGREFIFMFIGRKEFKGIDDTIKQATSVNNTEDENRNEIVRILKMGLIRYIMKTPGNKLIEIKSIIPETGNENVQDKWKSWVCNVNLSGFGSSEKNYKQFQLWSSASARKVTNDWKVGFSASTSYMESKYVFDDTITIRTYRHSNNVNHFVVRSLGKHWSAGYFYSLNNDTYSNIKLSNCIAAGVEYDIFPFEISSSKLITFRYKFGCNFNNYIDTTIYNKLNENLFSHSLSVGMNFITKWGSANASLGYSNYIHDFSKNNLYFNTNVNVRVSKGLSFSGSIYLSVIHDQLALIKSGATLEEVLLQQHQLATQYSVNGSLGVTYTFGSIYNNVVNPRFEY